MWLLDAMLKRLLKAPEGAFRTHLEHERASSKVRLSEDQLFWVATLALVSLTLTAVTRFMQLSKFASMDIEEIRTYHWVTPWLTLFATLLFMYVAWQKGVRYWLVYATSALSLVPVVVHIGLLVGLIQVEDIAAFNVGPNWWRGT